MPDCHALLSALLNEVKTLSNTVTIQGRKTDAILSRLSIPASAYAADEQCRRCSRISNPTPVNERIITLIWRSYILS